MANKQPSNPYRFVGVGAELGGAVLVMAFIGYHLDEWLGNEKPWGVLILSMVGIFGGLYNLIKSVMKDGES